MSAGAVLRVYLAEKRARKIIEDAKERAKKILEEARTKASFILSEENIEKLMEGYLKELSKELESLKREYILESDEEYERLSSISDSELNEIVDKLVEVILSGEY